MRLQEYFRSEAEDYVAALETAVTRASFELDAVQNCARRLSGVARLAGEPRILRAAVAIDQVSRTTRPAHAISLSSVLRDALPHFRVLMAADGSDTDLDAHADAVVERCSNEQPFTSVDDHATAVDEAEFREFVRDEVAGIADVLEGGIAEFLEDPTGRDTLGAILRRQRSLLGSARLSEVGIVAETLRAVEDLAELIVRLEVPVKSEWLDVFRTARDVLRAAAATLDDGDVPVPTHALSRLRTLREELIDRYGDRHAGAGDAQPASARLNLAPDSTIYERAGRLRMELMNAIGANARARVALEELYALAMRANL